MLTTGHEEGLGLLQNADAPRQRTHVWYDISRMGVLTGHLEGGG